MGFGYRLETVIGENRAGIEPKGLVMDFQEQSLHHIQIRDAFAAAINARRSDADTIALPERDCPAGRWIYGEAARRWAGHHAYLGLLEAHRAFHQQADIVAAQIRRQQWSEGQKALRAGSPFTQALADLNAALRRMRTATAALSA